MLGFFAIYEAEHTTLHTNSEARRFPAPRPFGRLAKERPGYCRKYCKETRLFCITKGSLGDDERPVLALSLLPLLLG